MQPLSRESFPSKHRRPGFGYSPFPGRRYQLQSLRKRHMLDRWNAMNSTRNFLKQMSGAALAASAAPSLWSSSTQSGSIDIPGENGMIIRSFRFVDLETPVEYFNTWLTPVPHFFVRNHMHEPSELNTESCPLTVRGEVEKPLTITLAELSKFETHSVVNTLECAGNGRSLHRPQVPGIQWGKGAVGTARFSGPRLLDVL